MEIIKQKDNQIVFKEKIEESLINSLRRYLNEIPILGIDELEISRNDSPLYDETVAHRMGLIPLKMDKKFNAKTELILSLKTKKEGMVYSSEIEGEAEVIYDKIPITFLNKDQEISISVIARVGKGSKHAKFSPGLLFYRNVVDIKTDKDCPKKVIELCPKRVFVLEGDKIKVNEKDKCDMCDVCTDFCKKEEKDGLKITPTDELIISIESFGQMDTKDILAKSIEMLKKDLEIVSKKLK